MKNCPAHVEGFVESATSRFADEADDYHHYFQIVCPCAGERFVTELSNKKTLRARCEACGRSVTVYDLSRYPAASKGRGPEEFREPQPPGQVFVMYEYGERDEGEPFDRDDITWCRAWIEDDKGELVLILDDETA